MTKFPFSKYGIKCDPRGAHVVFSYKSRALLGEVIAIRYEAITGATRLTVRHFNGELWPIEPCARLVNVLERTYEKDAA